MKYPKGDLTLNRNYTIGDMEFEKGDFIRIDGHTVTVLLRGLEHHLDECGITYIKVPYMMIAKLIKNSTESKLDKLKEFLIERQRQHNENIAWDEEQESKGIPMVLLG